MIKRKPKLTPLSKQRNKLVLGCMGWARDIAAAVHFRLPPFILLSDLESEAYVGLVKAARKYNFESAVPFKGYAFRLVKGQVIESVRRKNFRHTSTLQLTEFPDAIAILRYDPLESIERTLDQKAVYRELSRAIAALPAQDQELLKLRYVDGLNGREAGEAMGVGACVSSLQHKEALANLRRRLEGSPHFKELQAAA